MPDSPTRRAMAGIGAFAVLLATASVLGTSAAPSTASACPPNETEDSRTTVCMPVPPSDVIEETTPVGGGPPEIAGVPCTGHNSYECIGLAEEGLAAGPTASPTVTETHDP